MSIRINPGLPYIPSPLTPGGSHYDIQWNNGDGTFAGTDDFFYETGSVYLGYANGDGRYVVNNNNTNYLSNDGSNAAVWIQNSNSGGQNIVQSTINGVSVAKWRTDYVGNISWVADNSGSHNFYVGGDYAVGLNPFNLYLSGGITMGASYGGSDPGANKVVISSSVGIGLTNPNNMLDVSGAVMIGSGYVGSFFSPTNGLAVQGQTFINQYGNDDGTLSQFQVTAPSVVTIPDPALSFSGFGATPPGFTNPDVDFTLWAYKTINGINIYDASPSTLNVSGGGSGLSIPLTWGDVSVSGYVLQAYDNNAGTYTWQDLGNVTSFEDTLVLVNSGTFTVGPTSYQPPAGSFNGDSRITGNLDIATISVSSVAGIDVTITTAALTPLGSQGSMTFSKGILTAQTQAT